MPSDGGSFSQEDLPVLALERYEHPDPRVQKRIDALWLISQKVTRHVAANGATPTDAFATRGVRV